MKLFPVFLLLFLLFVYVSFFQDLSSYFGELIRVSVLTLKSWGRMWLAYFLSLFVGFTSAYAMYKSELVEKILFPIIDIFQSVPILTFFPLALYFFIESFPIVGVELAMIFLIFTSMVWNLIFAFYESLLSLPRWIKELVLVFKMDYLNFFFRLYLPYSLPSLIQNSRVSWANGFYFLIATEIISIGAKNYVVEGIGSYLLLSSQQGLLGNIFLGLASVMAVIYFMNEYFWTRIRLFLKSDVLMLVRKIVSQKTINVLKNYFEIINSSFYFVLSIIIALSSLYVCFDVLTHINLNSILETSYAFLQSFIRILEAYVFSVLWTVPTAVLLFRSRLKNVVVPILEFIASIPFTALFPVLLLFGLEYLGLENLSVLFLMTGMQWYILFNVYAGLEKVPSFIEDVRKVFKITERTFYFKVLLPVAAPLFFVGSLSAMGGGWNAIIVAEYVEFGGKNYSIDGVGSLMINSLKEGNVRLALLSAIFVGAFLPLLNIFLWKPLIKKYSWVFADVSGFAGS